MPYRGVEDNHTENGLLLRSDIHTLFDLDLLGIDPDGLIVQLHPDIAKEYQALVGVRLGGAAEARPSLVALKNRYEQFLERRRRPA